MAPHRLSAGASGLASALVHRGPIRFIGLVALLSGIASHGTSGALSQSPPRPRVAHLSPPLASTPPPSVEGEEVTEGGGGQVSPANGTEDLTAEGRRPPPVLSDSILDMIDTEQVDRVLAKKRREEEMARSRAHEVDARTEGRQADSTGRDRGHHRMGSNRRDKSFSEEGGGRSGRGRGMRRDKSDSRKPHRGKRPTDGKRAGHKASSTEGHHRVSLSRLAKWLDISPLSSYPIPNLPIPASPEPMPPVRDGSREKILKSSKDALVVTRREYLRRDWCRTEPLIQRIKIDGCLSRSMVNGFCYGQCNSFYIPRSPKELPASNTSLTMSGGHDFVRNKLGPLSSIPILYTQAFMSCAFCKPKEVTWVTISLRCPAIRPAQLTLRRRVERIKQCKCISEVLN